jgi:hypothetical protein
MTTRLPRSCRLAAALALFFGHAGCPGFGDRLPPDAALPDAGDAAGLVDADSPTPEAGPPADAAPDVPPAPLPRFDPDVADFLLRHCSLCHGELPVGGAPYALVTLEETRTHLAAILDRVVDKRDMPPGGGVVTDEEREMLTRWAEGGAVP